MNNTNIATTDDSHHPSDHQSQPPSQPQLPPGFRFHPTDEELVVQYLKRKVQSTPLPVSIIADVDLYKFDPWDLPAKAVFGEQEWYFFSPRDRKYPNGARPNRAAISGYWKATGTDKPVLSNGNLKVGVKKALVFYGGKPPRGIKTNWIMHEYRLVDNKLTNKPPCYDHINNNKKGSLRLDDWVLCRIYKKNNNNRAMDHHEREDSTEDTSTMGPISMSMSMSMPTPSSLNNIGHQLPFLNNQHGTIFDGMLGASHGMNVMNPTSSTNLLPLKRPLSALFWASNGTDNPDIGAGVGVNAGANGIGCIGKKGTLLQMGSDTDNNSNDNNNSDENGLRSEFQGNDNNNNITSISSLLNQFPSQTPPSVLDGVFRQSYPLHGLNWYT